MAWQVTVTKTFKSLKWCLLLHSFLGNTAAAGLLTLKLQSVFKLVVIFAEDAIIDICMDLESK